MSVKIRLKRMGSKKRPFYRIVATDSRNARDGRFIETLGYYNPMRDPADVNIKEDLVFKWMRRGAQPSGSTESILRNAGVLKKWALLKQGVTPEELDAKIDALKSTETQAMSADERRLKVEAADKAKAEAEAADKAKAEAEAADKAKAEAEAAEAPAEDAGDTDAPS